VSHVTHGNESCHTQSATNRCPPMWHHTRNQMEKLASLATGWRRLIGSPKLQIIFHKRATRYRSLLQKMTNKDKGSYESSLPCNNTICVARDLLLARIPSPSPPVSLPLPLTPSFFLSLYLFKGAMWLLDSGPSAVARITASCTYICIYIHI